MSGKVASFLLTVLSVFLAMNCRADTLTAVQTISVQLMPNGKLSVPASITLSSAGASFGDFAGSETIQYRARTSTSGGGTITAQASSEFTPAGGPAISNGDLKYTCGAPTLGTGCTGVQTVRTTSQTPVVQLPAPSCTGGGGQCSSADPNTVQLQFQLGNDPKFPTGTYTTTLTLTITTP